MLKRTTTTPDERAAAVHAYNEHQRDQMMDRQIYYKMRGLSARGNMLTIIQGGSDQAKYRIVRTVRAPKELEAKSQAAPKMKLLGSWCRNAFAGFWFVEEDVPVSPNLTVESLLTTLEEVRCKLARECTPMPAHLWVQLDNCPSEK